MTMRIFLVLIIAALGFFSAGAEGKVITPSAEKGENKVYIRADGLACYYCAYGLERFFKKSGRIAWYDMNMKEGIVEVGFIKGKPILSVETLTQFVYDAGFTARQIKAEFVGRLIQAPDGSYRFKVTETDQAFPVETNTVMQASRQVLDQEVTLIALAKEDPSALMRLAPERIQPKKEAAR